MSWSKNCKCKWVTKWASTACHHHKSVMKTYWKIVISGLLDFKPRPIIHMLKPFKLPAQQRQQPRGSFMILVGYLHFPSTFRTRNLQFWAPRQNRMPYQAHSWEVSFLKQPIYPNSIPNPNGLGPVDSWEIQWPGKYQLWTKKSSSWFT